MTTTTRMQYTISGDCSYGCMHGGMGCLVLVWNVADYNSEQPVLKLRLEEGK
jgi:hypothetical protein